MGARRHPRFGTADLAERFLFATFYGQRWQMVPRVDFVAGAPDLGGR
jgi:hypothetical protein